VQGRVADSAPAQRVGHSTHDNTFFTARQIVPRGDAVSASLYPREENNVRKVFFRTQRIPSLHRLPSGGNPLSSLESGGVDEGVVRLHPGTTKNDEPSVVPMTAELRSVLAEQKTLRHREYPVCQ
jgi:hypothetical protein